MGNEVYIIAHTERGTRLGEDMADRVNAFLRAPQRFFSAPGDRRGFGQPLSTEVQSFFSHANVLILIMDLETAIRILAPILTSRNSDPVVLVVDEAGKFVIKLLSGYKNETNQLVQNLAEQIGAQPVLTSVVEKQKVPLIDDLAKQYKMNIEARELIPKFTDALLNGEPMIIWDRWGLNVQWPEHVRVENSNELQFGNNEKLLLVIGYHHLPTIIPVKMQVMALRPVCLTVGVGCCQGVTGLRMIGAIRRYFREQNWSVRSIKQLIAVDTNANQAALGEAGRDFGVSVAVINANDFPKSSASNNKLLSSCEETEQGIIAETVAVYGSSQGKLIGVKRRIDQVAIAVAFNKEESPNA